MTLAGAKFVQLDNDGNRRDSEVYEAKGRKFTIGYYMACDYVLEDSRAKGVHCEIQIDAFGRVTIQNLSEKYPIKVNNNAVSMKHPLVDGAVIAILDRHFIWEFPRSQTGELENAHCISVTPTKAAAILPTEQLANSCPEKKGYRGQDRRLTVHNFAYTIKSDPDALDKKEEPTAQTPEAKMNLKMIHATRNKGNRSTEKEKKQLSFCQQSDVVITSFSPRETGVKIEKSFTAVIKPTTPRSVYSTPRSVQSLFNEEEDSQDFIDFSTPATSKKNQGRLAINSSMHLIDLTTPKILRPASPYMKTANLTATKKQLLAVGGVAQSQLSDEQLGVSALPPTPQTTATTLAADATASAPRKTNSESDTSPDSVTSSIISVDSSGCDSSSVVEVSDSDITPGIPQQATNKMSSLAATPARATSPAVSPKAGPFRANVAVASGSKGSTLTTATTPKRTPQSLRKRALLASAQKKNMLSRVSMGANSPNRPGGRIAGISPSSSRSPSKDSLPKTGDLSNRRVLFKARVQGAQVTPARRSLMLSTSFPAAGRIGESQPTAGTSASSSSSSSIKSNNITPFSLLTSTPVRRANVLTANSTSVNRMRVLPAGTVTSAASKVRKSMFGGRVAMSRSAQLLAKARKSASGVSPDRLTVKATLKVGRTAVDDKKAGLEKNGQETKPLPEADNENAESGVAVAATLNRTFTLSDEETEVKAEMLDEQAVGTSIKKDATTTPEEKANGSGDHKLNVDESKDCKEHNATFTPKKATGESPLEDEEVVNISAVKPEKKNSTFTPEKTVSVENVLTCEAEVATIEVKEETYEAPIASIAAQKDGEDEGVSAKEPKALEGIKNVDFAAMEVEPELLDNTAAIVCVIPEDFGAVIHGSDAEQTPAEVLEANTASNPVKENTVIAAGVVAPATDDSEGIANLLEQIDDVLNKSDEMKLKHLDELKQKEDSEQAAEDAETLLLEEGIDEGRSPKEDIKTKTVELKTTAVESEKIPPLSVKAAKPADAIKQAVEPKTPKFSGMKEMLRLPKSEVKTPRFGGLRDLMRTPKKLLGGHGDQEDKLEGLGQLLQTPKVMVAETQKTPNRRSMTKDAAHTPLNTPRRMATRRSSMLAEMGSAGGGGCTQQPPLTPKRITKRRPSLQFELSSDLAEDGGAVGAAVDSDLEDEVVPQTPQPKTMRRHRVLLEETVGDMGAIVEEEDSKGASEEVVLLTLTPTKENKELNEIKEHLEIPTLSLSQGVGENDVDDDDEIIDDSIICEEIINGSTPNNKNMPVESSPPAACDLENKEASGVPTEEEEQSPKNENSRINETIPSEKEDKKVKEIVDVSEYDYAQELKAADKDDNEELAYEEEPATDTTTFAAHITADDIEEPPTLPLLSKKVTSPKTPVMLGIRQLLKTPQPAADTPQLIGVRDLLRTPKTNRRGALVVEDNEFEGLNELIQTPAAPKRPTQKETVVLDDDEDQDEVEKPDAIVESLEIDEAACEIDYQGVREMLRTPKSCSTPIMRGMRQMLQTPKAAAAATPQLGGLKELMETPRVQVAGVSGRQQRVASALLEAGEEVAKDDGLEKFLKTPSAKNVMIANEPASAVIEQIADSVELLPAAEGSLHEANTTVGNLGEIFKTPVASRFAERLAKDADVVLEPSDDEDDVKEEKSIAVMDDQQKSSGVDVARKSALLADRFQTPGKPTPASPFTACEVLSDLPERDVREWVDRLEDSDVELLEEQDALDEAPGGVEDEGQITILEEAEDEACLDPIAATIEKPRKKSESIMMNATTTTTTLTNQSHLELTLNTSAASEAALAHVSHASLADDPLAFTAEKKATAGGSQDDSATPAKLAAANKSGHLDRKVADSSNMSGINFLDRTDDSMEPLVISDGDSDVEEVSDKQNKNTSQGNVAIEEPLATIVEVPEERNQDDSALNVKEENIKISLDASKVEEKAKEEEQNTSPEKSSSAKETTSTDNAGIENKHIVADEKDTENNDIVMKGKDPEHDVDSSSSKDTAISVKDDDEAEQSVSVLESRKGVDSAIELLPESPEITAIGSLAEDDRESEKEKEPEVVKNLEIVNKPNEMKHEVLKNTDEEEQLLEDMVEDKKVENEKEAEAKKDEEAKEKQVSATNVAEDDDSVLEEEEEPKAINEVEDQAQAQRQDKPADAEIDNNKKAKQELAIEGEDADIEEQQTSIALTEDSSSQPPEITEEQSAKTKPEEPETETITLESDELSNEATDKDAVVLISDDSESLPGNNLEKVKEQEAVEASSLKPAEKILETAVTAEDTKEKRQTLQRSPSCERESLIVADEDDISTLPVEEERVEDVPEPIVIQKEVEPENHKLSESLSPSKEEEPEEKKLAESLISSEVVEVHSYDIKITEKESPAQVKHISVVEEEHKADTELDASLMAAEVPDQKVAEEQKAEESALEPTVALSVPSPPADAKESVVEPPKEQTKECTENGSTNEEATVSQEEPASSTKITATKSRRGRKPSQSSQSAAVQNDGAISDESSMSSSSRSKRRRGAAPVAAEEVIPEELPVEEPTKETEPLKANLVKEEEAQPVTVVEEPFSLAKRPKRVRRNSTHSKEVQKDVVAVAPHASAEESIKSTDEMAKSTDESHDEVPVKSQRAAARRVRKNTVDEDVAIKAIIHVADESTAANEQAPKEVSAKRAAANKRAAAPPPTTVVRSTRRGRKNTIDEELIAAPPPPPAAPKDIQRDNEVVVAGATIAAPVKLTSEESHVEDDPILNTPVVVVTKRTARKRKEEAPSIVSDTESGASPPKRRHRKKVAEAILDDVEISEPVAEEPVTKKAIAKKATTPTATKRVRGAAGKKEALKVAEEVAEESKAEVTEPAVVEKVPEAEPATRRRGGRKIVEQSAAVEAVVVAAAAAVDPPTATPQRTAAKRGRKPSVKTVDHKNVEAAAAAPEVAVAVIQTDPATTPSPSSTRKVPRRAAAAQERNYDESSDTEAASRKQSATVASSSSSRRTAKTVAAAAAAAREAESQAQASTEDSNASMELTSSRARTRKPTAKAQQLMEEELVRSSTPKRRLLSTLAATPAIVSETETPQKAVPARRTRKASTYVEPEALALPTTPQNTRGRGGGAAARGQRTAQSALALEVAEAPAAPSPPEKVAPVEETVAATKPASRSRRKAVVKDVPLVAAAVVHVTAELDEQQHDEEVKKSEETKKVQKTKTTTTKTATTRKRGAAAKQQQQQTTDDEEKTEDVPPPLPMQALVAEDLTAPEESSSTEEVTKSTRKRTAATATGRRNRRKDNNNADEEENAAASKTAENVVTPSRAKSTRPARGGRKVRFEAAAEAAAAAALLNADATAATATNSTAAVAIDEASTAGATTTTTTTTTAAAVTATNAAEPPKRSVRTRRK